MEIGERRNDEKINYSPEEGILPDAGDINIDVVKQFINMDNDEEDENYNIKNNENNIEYSGLKNDIKNKEKNET